MNNVALALRDVVAVLDELQVPYAVMGGLAVRAHGIPRPTRDVDVTIAIDRTELPGLYRLMRDKGYSIPEVYETGWVDEVAGMAVVKLRSYEHPGGVDVDLFLAESDFQTSLISRRIAVDLVEGRTWLATAEDLILLKLLAARPRDFVDVADILFVQGRLDEGYMRSWAERLGVRDSLERALVERTE